MIRVYTEKNFLSNWPTFTTFNAAWNYIKENSAAFENGDIIALVNFKTQQTKYIRAQFKMDFEEITE